jgi:hypothetical protein
VTTPPRPDQAIDPPAAVLAPGGASGVFRGRLVVIFGSGPGTGLFVYNPTVGAGNLADSIAAQAGTDQSGNSYFRDFVSYSGGAAGSVYSQMTSGNIRFGIISDAGTGSGGSINLLTSPVLQIQFASPEPFAFTDDIVFASGQFAYAGTDSQGQVKETWHNLTLTNGWTGTFRYRLLPDGRVEVDVNISSAAATAFVCGTMPAAYIPASTVYMAAGSTGNVASSVAPFLQFITGSGNVTMNGLHAFSTAGQWVAGGSYPLT